MKLTKLFSTKRAADPNQIFIYISALVIVGFVFLYGFKAVMSFIGSSNDLELAKFVKDFKAKASSVSTEFGSTEYFSITIPAQFDHMCIIDTNSAISIPADCEHQVSNNIELGKEICDTWAEYKSDSTVAQKNVFFTDKLKHVGFKDTISDIALDSSVHTQGFLCTSTGQLKMVGQARVAIISTADP